MKNKDKTSGHFGEWINDKYNMPAYVYTCNQLNDKKSIFPTNTMWKKRNDHYHQVGNDRVVGFASNYGYFQVRQDEGGPKFLNDFDPKNNQFAGGFGYLNDEAGRIISTYYSENNLNMGRIFGIGYFEKEIEDLDYNVKQTIYAPFGDRQFVISRVDIKNKTLKKQNVKWYEYWGGQMYQFTYRPVSASTINKTCAGEAILFRREFDRNFSKKFIMINSKKGIVCKRHFEGWYYPEKGKLSIKDVNKLIPPTKGDKIYEDLMPPQVFLTCLSGKIDGIQTNADVFFGKGGVNNPDGLNNFIHKFDDNPINPAFVLMKKLTIDINETKTIYFAYGYLNKDDKLDKILKEYNFNIDSLFERTLNSWKKNLFFIDVPKEPWIKREMIWNNYYLRSSLSYDDYYKEHLLNQAGGYQYVMGFQGCPRDPLQHLLPFIFTNQKIAKEVLRFSLKLILPGGRIPMAISGHGCIFEEGFLPSDQELWYLWVVSEYILATRDYQFLNEFIQRPDNNYKNEKIIDILIELYNHLIYNIGFGKHGLVRMLRGDWSNSILLQNVPADKIDQVAYTAESLTNSTMAVYALCKFSQILEIAGYQDFSKESKLVSNSIKKALKGVWNGEWFQRAFLDDEFGWIGDDEIWLEPQPWAIIDEILTNKDSKILMNNIKDLLIDPSPIGCMKRNVPDYSKRKKVDGQVWWSLNGTLIWALAKQKSTLAWIEWKKNSFAMHASKYPDIWFGIWSGPDCYTSVLSNRPGETRFNQDLVEKMNKDIDKINGAYEIMDYSFIDFPIANVHAHAWPLYSFTKLLGIEFTAAGMVIAPAINEQKFCLKTNIIRVIKNHDTLLINYRPFTDISLKIIIDMSFYNNNELYEIYVNDKQKEIQFDKYNRIVLYETTVDKNICFKLVLKK